MTLVSIPNLTNFVNPDKIYNNKHGTQREIKLPNIKVLMRPTHKEIGTDNGVGQVLLNYSRHFSEVGLEIVDESCDSFDITVSHLGFDVNADVHHNHGLWIGVLDEDQSGQNKLIVESVRRARSIIVPSDYVAQYFRRDVRIDPNVIGHGVNIDEWQGASSRGYALWDKNRISKVCNPHAVNVLAKSFTSTQFVTTFAEDSTPGNIHELGRMSFAKMKELTLGAHVYIATTKETFGISILQAMAAGIPIVGYDWGGASDIVRNGIDGALVKPNDERALVEAFNYVMNNRDELGYNASERAKDYSWVNVCQKIKNVYSDVIESKTKEPSASIIIPCYNYADYLVRSVQSACMQTGDIVKEVIIVNDGSTDDTHNVAMQLLQKDNRIKYIRQQNAGVANARNTGIENATSEYVCCLDADDELSPKFIETMVNGLESDRSISLAYSKLALVHSSGDVSVGAWPDEFSADEMLKGHNQVPTCCVFRKRDWQRLGGYKQRYCPKGFGAEDAEFWLRFTKHGYRSKLMSNEPLFIYHLGGGTSKEYKEPNWLSWHTDLETGWLPFSCLGDKEIKPVTEYDQPLYSVIIPVGPGHEIYLEDALDSVEAQSDKRWECIVVINSRQDIMINNNSLDRIVFAYPHVKFVFANDKQGAGYARNVGVKHSSGKYLVFLDADDYLQPRFLELTRKAKEHFNVDWVYTDIYTQTEDGIQEFQCHEWDVNKLWRHGIMAVTCLYTREMFDAVGGFDEDNNREDWDLHLALANHGYCGSRLPIPLFTYRQQLGYRREYRKIATSQEQSKEMKIADVKRLHGKYQLEKLIMACKTCGGNRVEIQDVSSGDLLTMTYIGRNASMSNEITFVGPITRKKYRTNNGKIVNVHPQDADEFEKKLLFKRLASVGKRSPIATTTPKNVVVEQKSWEAQMKEAMNFAQDARDEAAKKADEFVSRIFGELSAEDDDSGDSYSDEDEKSLIIKSPDEFPAREIIEFIEVGDLTKDDLEEMYNNEVGLKNRVTVLRAIANTIEHDFD